MLFRSPRRCTRATLPLPFGRDSRLLLFGRGGRLRCTGLGRLTMRVLLRTLQQSLSKLELRRPQLRLGAYGLDTTVAPLAQVVSEPVTAHAVLLCQVAYAHVRALPSPHPDAKPAFALQAVRRPSPSDSHRRKSPAKHKVPMQTSLRMRIVHSIPSTPILVGRTTRRRGDAEDGSESCGPRPDSPSPHPRRFEGLRPCGRTLALAAHRLCCASVSTRRGPPRRVIAALRATERLVQFVSSHSPSRPSL